ncbi:Crp/Fnr family transcriptional regulator [uncultured Polaribacter sp.]|uniref:Crp/Fnr family transcriptional regulator n=1 Tax=uncultured Polaribacter sp. TaxID=174711 RepID=UPI00261449F9|nr:Crp/Fnr family transcriptional regulator [uncultured Polaribacter sp.]
MTSIISIPKTILLNFGALKKQFLKNELIFKEHTTANYFYCIESGMVKMNNFNDDGKEFIQGIFYEGQSFGEPPLFINTTYPANAIAITDVTLLVLSKNKLFDLLQQNQDIHLMITTNLAKRLHYKAIIASEISSQEPEHRILRYFDYLKKENNSNTTKFSYKINHTRQQIADILGLRVETVIRGIKNLEKNKELQIIKRKVFR